MELVNPEIAVLSIAWTAGILRLVARFYSKDLNKYTKMTISTVLGGVIGIWVLSDLTTQQSVLEALKIGLLSGFSATTGYAAVKHLIPQRKLNLPV